MSAVYRTLNHDLLGLVEGQSIPIRHITGEARVLVDPAHRTVIAKNMKQGSATTVACRQSDPPITDAFSFISAQKRRWKRVTWPDLIDMLSLCACGAIRISVLDRPATIHYSIFGRDRMLLQEHHEHPSERKSVWYLRSRELVSDLADQTAHTFARAESIPPTSFSSLLQWLYSEPIYPLIRASQINEAMRAHLSEADIARLVDLGIVAASESGSSPLSPLLDPDFTFLGTPAHPASEGWT
jgi:hypothetical protein